MRHCPNPECPHLVATGHCAELRDDIELCPDCGQPTAWGPSPGDPPISEPAEPQLGEDPTRLVEVAEFTTLHEAEMAREMLRAYGIHAELTDRYVSGMGLPLHALGGGLHMLVRPDQIDQARDLLTFTREDD